MTGSFSEAETGVQKKRVKYLAALFGLLALMVLPLFFLLVHSGDDKTLPSYATVKAGYVPSEAWLLGRHGAVLAEKRVDFSVRRLQWAPLADVSPALTQILVASEDKRFFEHAGVDWQAVLASAWHNLWHFWGGRHPRGASTITMQLAAFLEPDLTPRDKRRSVAQKWEQMRAALKLEQTWSKQQILEAYLNLAPFRGEIVGIGAASSALFGKSPGSLDRAESMLLVALLKGPTAGSETIAKRACAISMVTDEKSDPDCGDLRALAYASLSAPSDYLIREPDIAPHLAWKLLRKPGSRVHTTLNADLQRFAIRSLHEHLLNLTSQDVKDGAVIVIDNASGDVLAYVGSSSELSDAPDVDAVQALRQAGSTLKPFLYGMALDRKLLTAASILDDSPIRLSTPTGLYIPQDYDHDFKGPVSVRTALASSLNVPAVRTLVLVGVNRFVQELRNAGLDSLTEDGNYYGYGLALGGADVRLAQLTNAYRALANGGMWTPASFVPGAEAGGKKRILSRQAAYIIANILSDRSARATTFGLDNPLATRVWAAVKTGTSKDMRDNWCIGFTRRFTVGVWAGNANGAPMWDVSGVSGAGPVWQDIVEYLHRNHPSLPPPAPHGVVEQKISYAPAVEVPRQEWFINGTQARRIKLAAYARHARELIPHIVYPADGTIFAIDPDIPQARQRIQFSARSGDQVSWFVDGVPAGKGMTSLWAPVPGHHELLLTDARGSKLDSLGFDVRGGAVSDKY